MKWIVYYGGDVVFVVDSNKEEVLKQELEKAGYNLEELDRTELTQNFLRVRISNRLIVD